MKRASERGVLFIKSKAVCERKEGEAGGRGLVRHDSISWFHVPGLGVCLFTHGTNYNSPPLFGVAMLGSSGDKIGLVLLGTG